MGVELRPLGVKCNIQCRYCYQEPQRNAGNVSREYSIPKMKEALELEGAPFILFGGEPLLVPLRDLEELWSYGLERFGKNGIQTNGTLIKSDHIALFKHYKVHVGISIDGPGELNGLRWQGTEDLTLAATEKTMQAIRSLCLQDHVPSIIVTLHNVNASPARLPRLLDWIKELHSIGVRAIRLHLLESESEEIRRSFGLTVEESIGALTSFMALEGEVPGLRFDLFREMRDLLVGADQKTTCVWYACDPFTTKAVRGVEGQGQRSNCGRTNKDGVDFLKSDKAGFERYLALYQTPQNYGGCQGCRFFLMCKGQCPGTAIANDWRNRTEHCAVWMSIFERLESELISQGRLPLSVSENRSKLEQQALEQWHVGKQFSMSQALRELESIEQNLKSGAGTLRELK